MKRLPASGKEQRRACPAERQVPAVGVRDGREGPRALGETNEVVAGVRLPVGGDREADLVRPEGLRGRPAVRGPAAE